MDVGKINNQGLDVALRRELVLKQGPCQQMPANLVWSTLAQLHKDPAWQMWNEC